MIFKNNFDEFIESNNKVIEDIKKYLGEMGYMMEDIKTTSSKSMASLKDLKNLEDKLISKMLEFGEQINEKFADAIYPPNEVTGRYPGFDNFQLNYENECSKYFKYRKNSKMDIVIFA